jgi:hypothetical protein
VHGHAAGFARGAVTGGDGGRRRSRSVDARHEVTDQRWLAITDQRVSILNQLALALRARRQPLDVADLDLQLFTGGDVGQGAAQPAVARPLEHAAGRGQLLLGARGERDLADLAGTGALDREAGNQGSGR